MCFFYQCNDNIHGHYFCANICFKPVNKRFIFKYCHACAYLVELQNVPFFFSTGCHPMTWCAVRFWNLWPVMLWRPLNPSAYSQTELGGDACFLVHMAQLGSPGWRSAHVSLCYSHPGVIWLASAFESLRCSTGMQLDLNLANVLTPHHNFHWSLKESVANNNTPQTEQMLTLKTTCIDSRIQ